MVKHGTLILVGRNREKLHKLQTDLEAKGGYAVFVVCDLSDLASVQRAAVEPIVGLHNNAGISPLRPEKMPRAGIWPCHQLFRAVRADRGTVPHLTDGAIVTFIASAVEDPERKPAKILGMKGGWYLSAEASVRGEWLQGGSSMPGVDAYATSKQCLLAAALKFARETPRLRFDAIEPGIIPATGLARDANIVVRFLFSQLMTLLPPFSKFRSTPERAARIVTNILTDPSVKTGVYFDEKGQLVLGSEQMRDPAFQDRVAAETRALLSRFRHGNVHHGYDDPRGEG
ncbi:Rossmann-fold NAD(P)-binding domain-containing protein [Tunturiibacter lichenicola]|uniref:short-chain dehydrogenase n=1 Tax=Tunturiibacter lichenicola TaxID=2051959 RepID=UPI0021B37E6E|nr:short-chain dehydrogenase [Edaphobacter lichenicola]